MPHVHGTCLVFVAPFISMKEFHAGLHYCTCTCTYGPSCVMGINLSFTTTTIWSHMHKVNVKLVKLCQCSCTYSYTQRMMVAYTGAAPGGFLGFLETGLASWTNTVYNRVTCSVYFSSACSSRREIKFKLITTFSVCCGLNIRLEVRIKLHIVYTIPKPNLFP